MILHRVSVLALAVLGLSVACRSAQAGVVSASAPASVTIMAPAAVIGSSSQAIGAAIRPTKGANTVRLDPNGGITVAGPGDGSSTHGASGAAELALSASPGTTYSLSDSLIFAEPGLTNVAATSAGATGAIPSSGLQKIRYGATFAINSVTPSRTYTGMLTVIANYN